MSDASVISPVAAEPKSHTSKGAHADRIHCNFRSMIAAMSSVESGTGRKIPICDSVARIFHR